VSFTHECSRLIHVYRWPIIGQRSLDGQGLTAEHRRSDRGEQTPPHDPSPCLGCSYAAVCRRLIRCRDVPVCIAPSRDQRAPDRAELLLHRLRMLHYANSAGLDVPLQIGGFIRCAEFDYSPRHV